MRGGGKPVTPGKMLQKQLRDLVWLLRGELYSLRLSWFWYLFHMALSPLLYMFLLYLFGGRGRPEVTLFVVSGSLAQGLTTASMLTLGQNIGSLKDQHAFEYYATLPISRVTFLLATATRAVLFSLPSFLTILCVGTLTLQLPIRLSLLILPVVLLAGYCLAGLGAFIGFYSPTGQVASLATQVLTGLMVSLAPVYLAMEQLPGFLRTTAHFIPTTYVASALRAVLSGQVGPRTWLDLGVLAAVTLVSMWLVARKLDWRAGQG